MTTLTAATDGAEWNGLEIGQGYDADWSMQVLDDAGVPVNLTGYVVKITLRLGYGEPVALTAASNVAADSYVTITAGTGTVTFHLDHADTVLLSAPKNYVFDVRFINGGAETRKLWGKCYVRPQVTASA